MSGLRAERIAASAQHRDGAFRNGPIRPGLRSGGGVKVVGEFMFRGGRTPPGPLPSENPLAAWARPPETGLRATWLGHSTVLLEVDGARVLTDPVWGKRASPVRFAGPKRFQPVPVAIVELPPLDAIVISHDHYDHLDRPTIRALAKTACRSSRRWASARTSRLGRTRRADHRARLVGAARVPGHQRRRSPPRRRSTSPAAASSENETLWSSLAIRGPRHRVFFSGDTGLTAAYAEIGDRLGPFDLVLLEVGAYHPSWGDIHLGPENALEALCAPRRRRVPARPLGHVQPRDPRVGRARRDARRARAETRRAPRDATARRRRRAVADGPGRRAVVARARQAARNRDRRHRPGDPRGRADRLARRPQSAVVLGSAPRKDGTPMKPLFASIALSSLLLACSSKGSDKPDAYVIHDQPDAHPGQHADANNQGNSLTRTRARRAARRRPATARGAHAGAGERELRLGERHAGLRRRRR